MPANKNGPLVVLRIIWAALLLGQFAFAAIITFVLWPQGLVHTNAHEAQILAIFSTIFMFVMLPLAFVVRKIAYQPSPDGKIAPGRYSTGNIIFYTICEAVAMVGLIAMMMHQGPSGVIFVPAVAVALQIVNYPSGTPQRSAGFPLDAAPPREQ
jgi:hypothetical protein